MRKYWVGLLLGTLLALVYVHQKVSLISLGYRVEALGHQKDELLDQYRVLHYNVLTLRSPVILQERLAQRNILLTPPRTVEILFSPFQATPSVSSLEGVGRPSFSLFQWALKLAAGWLGGGQQAVAEPAAGQR